MTKSQNLTNYLLNDSNSSEKTWATTTTNLKIKMSFEEFLGFRVPEVVLVKFLTPFNAQGSRVTILAVQWRRSGKRKNRMKLSLP
jgi:hypothetical protein